MSQKVSLHKVYWFQEGPGVRNWQFKDNGIKLLNVANITKSGFIDLSKTDRYLLTDEVSQKYSHFLIDEGDLVIASSGITNDVDNLLRTKIAFVEKKHLPLCLNTSTIRFKAIEGVSDLNFLKHWLNSLEFRTQITKEVTGIAQKNFGPSHLKRLKITLPPLEEQRRIAAILDQADALRQKRQQSLEKLDQLLQAAFIEMFGEFDSNPKGWIQHPLSNIVNENTVVTYGIVQAGEDCPDGVPYIRTGDIKDGVILIDNLKKTHSDIAKKYQRSRVETGDIVMSIRATVGTTAMVPEALNGANLTQGTARIAAGDKIEREFLLYHLRCSATQNWINRHVKGATFREITLGKLRELPIYVPPKELQIKFVYLYKKFDLERKLFVQSQIKLNNLFNSLQQKAFTGRL